MKRLLISILCLLSIAGLTASEKERKEQIERGFAAAERAQAPEQHKQQQASIEEDESYNEFPDNFGYIKDDQLGVAVERTYLIDAILGNDVKAVKNELSKGANPNGVYVRYGDLSTSPLFIAAFKGFEDIVKILLDAGADPKIVDRGGHNAAFYAQQQNHPNIVKLLSEYKASPVKITKWQLEKQKEFLPGKKREISAQAFGYTFSNKGSDSIPRDAQKIFTAIRNNNIGLLHKALHEKQNVNAQTNDSKMTPLIYAARMNRPALVKLLLKANADTSLQDEVGKRFIDYAKEKPQVMEIVKQYRDYIAAIMTKTGMSKDAAKHMSQYLGG